MTTKCYLAHPVTEYGDSVRQRAAIAEIEARGWHVENPDTPTHQELYRKLGMDHFIALVGECDVLAFMRFPTGEIGAGVAKEIEAALRKGHEVFEITDSGLKRAGNMMPTPVLSVEDTRRMVASIRQAAE